MKRKIYNEMLKWKEKYAGKYALLIEGARRVGKSYIAEEFAKNNYKSYIIIDFNNVNDRIKEQFYNGLNDLNTFYMYLMSEYGVQLYERESLIVFDEVQLFPRARSALKYLVADGRYDFIETGSLMGIKENVQDILIPSEEYALKMYPLDFEEFLWACGNETLMEVIKKNFNEHKEMGALHRKAMEYFRKYMIVGGMPQAVQTFVDTKYNLEETDNVKRSILKLYEDDMYKHASNYGLKVKKIFDEIPGQLQRHEKKFKITALDTDAKTRDYEDAFMWLQDAMIANLAFNTTEPSVGLKLNTDISTYKLYMGDTGLLLSHTFDVKTLVNEKIYTKILYDDLEFNEGMIMENIVAQMLICAGNELYFYSKASKESIDRMEIDFLVLSHKISSKHNICPIEVKSGKNYTLNSLNKFREKYSNFLDKAYVIHTGDYKEKDNVIYLPIYMTSLL